MAWNPLSDPFMFATGSHDGAVRIWTTPDGAIPEESASVSSSRSATQPSNTPRTVSPSPPSVFDADYRTDSPAALTDLNDTPSPTDGVDYFRRDNGKAVAFIEAP